MITVTIIATRVECFIESASECRAVFGTEDAPEKWLELYTKE